jgi:hypothetical protein
MSTRPRRFHKKKVFDGACWTLSYSAAAAAA